MDSLVINDIDQLPAPAEGLRVVISGGGTGGHINPALSIAQAILAKDPKAQILFVGALGRMEMERVPKAGFPIVGLPVRGLDRKRPWRNFGVIRDFLRARRRCRRIIDRFKPQVVVGVGGYASAPMLKAAQGKGIPTILQEQNSYAGVTNKMLAKRARYIDVAYTGMERFFPADSIHLTGNPIREEILNSPLTPEQAREQLGFDPKRPLLVVVGGSLGARTVNRAMEANIGRLADLGYSVLWQTGKNWPEVDPATLPAGCKAVRFIEDMATAYRGATLAVARAGACTISELQNLGKPSILIPSPNVAEDHQRHNAEALVKEDAARMVLDANAVDQIYDAVKELADNPQLLKAIGDNAAAMAHRGSAAIIADQVLLCEREGAN